MHPTLENNAGLGGWPFKLGQQVRVKPGDNWRADWQHPDQGPLYVCGIWLQESGVFRVDVVEGDSIKPTCDFDADDLLPA